MMAQRINAYEFQVLEYHAPLLNIYGIELREIFLGMGNKCIRPLTLMLVLPLRFV